MKRSLSAAGLALRLTWKGFALITLATVLVQTAIFMNQEVYFESKGFEWLLDEMGVAAFGRIGAMVLLGYLLLRCGRKNTGYTLRRLSLSEGSLTAWWSAVFAGWFLLYWGAQLATVLGLYTWYAQRIPVQSINLFVAAFRSAYFHMLLPLAEPVGYVRNGVLCLSFGAMAAMLSRQLRNGGKPWMFAVLLFISYLLPQRMGSEAFDGILSAALLGCVAVQWVICREVCSRED